MKDSASVDGYILTMLTHDLAGRKRGSIPGPYQQR